MFIIIITIIMLGLSDEFLCLIIAVLQRPFHSAKNTIQNKTLTNFFSTKIGQFKKTNIGIANQLLAGLVQKNCFQPLKAHISLMSVPGLLAGLQCMKCGL